MVVMGTGMEAEVVDMKEVGVVEEVVMLEKGGEEVVIVGVGDMMEVAKWMSPALVCSQKTAVRVKVTIIITVAENIKLKEGLRGK